MCDDADSLLLPTLLPAHAGSLPTPNGVCLFPVDGTRKVLPPIRFFLLVCLVVPLRMCLLLPLIFTPSPPAHHRKRCALVLSSLLFLSAADMSRDLFSFTIARPPSMYVRLLFPSIPEVAAAAKSLDPPLPPYFTDQSFVHTLVSATCLFHFGRN